VSDCQLAVLAKYDVRQERPDSGALYALVCPSQHWHLRTLYAPSRAAVSLMSSTGNGGAATACGGEQRCAARLLHARCCGSCTPVKLLHRCEPTAWTGTWGSMPSTPAMAAPSSGWQALFDAYVSTTTCRNVRGKCERYSGPCAAGRRFTGTICWRHCNHNATATLQCMLMCACAQSHLSAAVQGSMTESGCSGATIQLGRCSGHNMPI
jgi:hypothetical protein